MIGDTPPQQGTCTGVSYIDDQTIRCTLPNLFGVDFAVYVIIGGQISANNPTVRVSYRGPIITSLQLGTCSSSAPIVSSGSLSLTSVLGNEILCITGTGFTTTGGAGQLSVSYARPGTIATAGVGVFACPISTSVAPTDTKIQCATSQGIGSGLVMTIFKGSIPFRPSTVQLAYPRPIIRPQTIRSSITFAGGVNLVGTSQNALVLFDVAHVPTLSTLWPLISITMAQSTSSLISLTCTLTRIEPSPITIQPDIDRTITCRTQSGTGKNYRFTVIANGQSTASPGTDTFEFADDIPSITSVTGCTSQIITSTHGCSTKGGDIITLTGTNFCRPDAISGCMLRVNIGPYSCRDVLVTSSTSLVCVVPPGSGDVHPVSILVNTTLSVAPLSTLSYATPIITSVTSTSCMNGQANALVDCPVAGDVDITIIGTNFGPTGAQVLIGGIPCKSVTHSTLEPTSSVICRIPPGTSRDASIALIPLRGPVVLASYPLTISYVQCSPGYGRSSLDSPCTQCPSGTYGDPNVSEQCVPCVPGTFSSGSGSSTCSECSPGRYQPLQGQSSCAVTGYGACNPFPGASSQIPCIPGTHSSIEGSSSCSLCPIGRYTDSIQSLNCMECSNGKYSNQQGMMVCLDCPPGTESESRSGSTTCRTCAPGSVVGGINGTCIPCEAGTFSVSGLLCAPCPLGQYTNATTGFASCQTCPAGTERDPTNAKGCQPCKTGTFSAQAGVSECSGCLKGSHNNVTGASSCQECVPGRWSDFSASECTACRAGRYSGTYASVQCAVCPSGYYSPPASSSCQQCTPGSVPSDDLSSCSSCPAGRTASLGEQQCTSCLAGTYTNGTGQFPCTPCQPGLVSDDGASTCRVADAGTYATGGSSQQICPPGTYNNRTGQSVCLLCPKGTYPLTNRLSCSACPSGRSAALEGSSECISCPPGTFSYQNTSSAISTTITCQECAPGQYQDSREQSSCLTCPAGKFSPNSRSQSCSICEPGSYSNIAEGASQCTACSPGKVQKSPESSFCIDCEAGYYSAAAGGLECTPCAAGYYSPTKGSAACTPCEPGNYTDQPGATQCKPCPITTYAPDQGQAVCSPCRIGQFGNITGLSACSLCPPGRSNDREGQSDCIDCTIGFYSSIPGSLSCTACPTGRFQNIQGKSTCDLCPAGRFQQQSNATDCIDCAPGSYSASAGSPTCTPCAPGTYQTSFNQTKCTPCPAGYEQPAFGKLGCIRCPPGMATPIASPQCKSCPQGSFAELSGSSVCTECPTGKYQANSNQTSCISCPQGQANPMTGATTCKACDAGMIAPSEGAPSCNVCDARKTADTTRTRCVCAVGTYMLRSNRGPISHGNISAGSSTGGDSNSDSGSGWWSSSSSNSSSSSTSTGSVSSTGVSSNESLSTGSITSITSTGSSININININSSTNLPDAQIMNDTLPTVMPINGSDIISSTSSAVTVSSSSSGTDINTTSTSTGSSSTGAFSSSISQPTYEAESVECRPCLSGLLCSELGTFLEDTSTSPGWWRPSRSSESLYRCIMPDHCLGGINSTCQTYHHGPICAQCTQGTYSPTHGICKPCYGAVAANYAITILVMIAVIISVLVMYLLVIKGDTQLQLALMHSDQILSTRQLKRASSALAVMQANKNKQISANVVTTVDVPTLKQEMQSEIGDGVATVPAGAGTPRGINDHAFETSRISKSKKHKQEQSQNSALSASPSPSPDESEVEDDLLEGSVPSRTNLIAHEHMPRVVKPNVTYKLKIVLSFFQVTTALVTSLSVPWPAPWQSFVAFMSIFQLDFVAWSAMGCIAHIDYYSKLVANVIVPVIVIALIQIYYRGPHWWRRYRGTIPAAAISVDNVYRSCSAFRLVLFTLFLIYPNVSSTILSMYACHNIEGVEHLRVDYDVICYDSRWYSYLPLSIIAIFVYPVGIPIYFMTLLWRARKQLDQNLIRFRLGLLYDGYAMDAWYFEIVDLCHKLFMTSMLAFFTSSAQLRAGMVVCMLYAMFILIRRPYYRKGDDRLHLIAQCIIFAFLQAGLIFQQMDSISYSANAGMSSILIILIIGFLLLFFIQSGKHVYRLFRIVRTHHKQQHAREASRSRLPGITPSLNSRAPKSKKTVVPRSDEAVLDVDTSSTTTTTLRKPKKAQFSLNQAASATATDADEIELAAAVYVPPPTQQHLTIRHPSSASSETSYSGTPTSPPRTDGSRTPPQLALSSPTNPLSPSLAKQPFLFGDISSSPTTQHRPPPPRLHAHVAGPQGYTTLTSPSSVYHTGGYDNNDTQHDSLSQPKHEESQSQYQL